MSVDAGFGSAPSTDVFLERLVSQSNCTAGAERDATDWLVAIAAHNDLPAFIALFTSFAPRVKGYLRRRGMPEQRAEELAQEALLVIWRKADQFDPARANASAWIFTIVRNLWIDAVRHEQHPDQLYAVEPQEAQLTPEQLLTAQDDGAKLRFAVETLPKDQAEIVRMAYFDDLSHTQIAEGLGVPLGTVKSRIRSATLHLRRALEESD